VVGKCGIKYYVYKGHIAMLVLQLSQYLISTPGLLKVFEVYDLRFYSGVGQDILHSGMWLAALWKTYCLHLHRLSETEGSIFCHNFGTQLPNYMVSQSRKPHMNAVMIGNGHKLSGWDLVQHSSFPCY
jgi:hypothetical protein